MAIALNEKVVTAKTRKYGTDEVACPAGRSLKIETSPGGEEILDEECPVGKAWVARVSVEIIETDV